MEFLAEYGLFFVKIFTLVIAILVTLAGVLVLIGKDKEKTSGKIKVTKLNEKFEDMADNINEEVLTRKQFKASQKEIKKAKKEEAKKAEDDNKKRMFVLNFEGDIKASAVHALRNEITAVLSVANSRDEVLINLESAGGMVHAYGLAASQLQRIRQRNIPLTIAVDKVAASGGYMMACVGDKILAAPFAIIGSIGVIAQLPNFNRFLKKNNIDFEQLSAGEYKRTLTVFGENTDKARKKFKEEIEEVHGLFKAFITENRPGVDIDQVATGEHWLAKRAHEFNLVDKLITSDDYLLAAAKSADVFEITFEKKKTWQDKLAHSVHGVLGIFTDRWY